MAPEEALLPDVAAIRTDLEYMTARWHLLPEDALIELRAFKEDMQPQTVRFPHSSIEDAVEWAESMNEAGYNLYAVRNPIRSTCKGSASDGDILGAFFLWADCDDGDAASNVKRWGGPKYHAAIVTGRQPGPRVHTYWELAEPCFDLAAWRQCQEAIAAHFGSDRTVVNPSRIMRIGGTVSYPFRKKREKGYTREVVTVRTEYPDERPRVTLDQMQRAFGSSPHALQSAPHALQIDTGPRPLDRERARIQALSGQEWHNAVIRLVASYVAKGLSDDEIHGLTAPLTLPGYTPDQTAAEVQTAIDGARRKGWTPEPQPVPGTTDEDGAPLPFDTTPLSAADLEGIRPRAWLFGRKLIRGFCSVVVSPGGTAKSTWAAAVARDLVEGEQTMHDAPHKPCRVWIYNLEDPRDETLRKIAALAGTKRFTAEGLARLTISSGRDRPLIVAHEAERGLYVATPDVTAIIEAIKAANIDVLIVDPAVRAHRLPENDNKAIDLMMDQFARIAHEANVAVVLIHHTRKGFVGGEMDSMRGASAMGSAARVAITLQTMTPEEAVDMNIPEAERRLYVRADNAKANLAPPATGAEWYKLESQSIGNGDEEYPDGDSVGVIVKWETPDPWSDVGPFMVEIMDRIRRGYVREDGSTEPYSARKQAGADRFIANAVLASFPNGDKSEKQAMAIIRHWMSAGFLEEREYTNGKGNARKGVFVTNKAEEDEGTG